MADHIGRADELDLKKRILRATVRGIKLLQDLDTSLRAYLVPAGSRELVRQHGGLQVLG